MRRIRGVIAAAALALILGGCAKLPEVPYDRTAAGQVSKIGVITPRLPDSPSIILASSVGQSFGLVGALVDAGMQANREARFKAFVRDQNFSAEEALTQRLAATLEAEGFTVTFIPVKREQSDFVQKYPVDVAPAVDAYLDLVTSNYGYAAAGIRASAPYRPLVALKVRLVRASDNSVLMQEAVAYNSLASTGGVTISPDPRYQFKDFDTMAADPSTAVTGLKAAMEESAKTVGELLK